MEPHHLPSPTTWYFETEVTQARDANLLGEYRAFSMTKANTAPTEIPEVSVKQVRENKTYIVAPSAGN